MNRFYRMSHTLCRLVFRLSGGIQVYGQEYLPSTGAFLICANHCSLLDPPLIGSTFHRQIGYLAKKELFKYPIFSSILRALGVVSVDRSRLEQETIKKVIDTLKIGRPMVIFPEGTRSRSGELGRAKVGVGFLARLAGVAVVPAFIRNTRRWPFTLRQKHRLMIRFGPQLNWEWMAKVPQGKEGYRKIADEIMDRIRMLQSGAVCPEQPAGLPESGKTLCCVNMTKCPTGQI